MKDSVCVGIDGSLGAWIAVLLSGAGLDVRVLKTIGEIEGYCSGAARVLIDIPVGLPESAAEAGLRPDILLRQNIKGKASSVFNTPCRQAVYEEDKARAKELNQELLGKSLSEQSLAIRGAIRQVDIFLNEKPTWKDRLLESHPEYCFMLLNNGQPVLENKKTEAGLQKRLEILKKYYPDAEKVVYGIRKNRMDDVIDALCLAVVGRLSLENGLKTIPENPQEDRRGIRMQIVGI